MNIKKIEFRVSIDNKKYCNKCCKLIDTKRGFIFIQGELSTYNKKKCGQWIGGSSWNGGVRINLCFDCFDEFMRDKKEYEKKKNKIYEEMIKKRIIKGLK